MSLIKVYSVRTLNDGKFEYAGYDGKYDLRESNLVVIESNKVEELARIIKVEDKNDSDYVILRKGNKQDIEIKESNDKEARKILEFSKNLATKLKLDMKFIKIAYSLNRSKLILYFISDDRVDFRELLKELVSNYKTRIELKQIGSRDELKFQPTIGECGRKVCCASHLNKFSSVTIKDVKDQGLQINMGKITGMCGKLKCCLKYEQESYKENIKLLPKYNQEIKVKKTKEKGKVAGIDILNLKVRVKIINDKDEIIYETFDYKELEYKSRR